MTFSPTTIPALESDKKICEAFDCSNKAVTTIKVSAGNYGQISLNICRLCEPKFTNRW